MKSPATAVARLATCCTLLVLATLATWASADEDHPSRRWEKAIRAFEEEDRAREPQPGGVLFVGSSSIRMWDLQESFPGLAPVNRGFGGSQIADSNYYFERLILPHRPLTIALYAGDNDIAAGKSPETVLEDFKTFLGKVREHLPDTHVAFIAIKPSIARWKLVGRMRRANELIREHVAGEPLASYVDIDTPMLGDDGRPRSELFLDDGLHLNARGYRLWTSLVRPHLDPKFQARTVLEREGRIRVATCQFPVSADIDANARWIENQMREAARRKATVVHFSECALSGYAGVDLQSTSEIDWKLLRERTESIARLARELELWVVLGSTHRLSGDNKPHNSLYVIGPDSELVDRYDKRFCTGGDLRHYSPGDHCVTFEINGVTCGLLICYDIRFPEIFRRYHTLGAELIFHSFYNARQKPGSIHPKIMPPTAQARAATNYLFLSVNNSSAPRSWGSLFVTPDGLIEDRLPTDEPGVMVHTVDTTKRYYDASRPYRKASIEGKLHSGETVDDPRSRNRKAL